MAEFFILDPNGYEIHKFSNTAEVHDFLNTQFDGGDPREDDIIVVKGEELEIKSKGYYVEP